MRPLTRWLGLLLGGTACAPLAAAPDSGSWTAALRYRYEDVQDDAFERDAHAHTARLRLGWQQPFAHGFSALVEGEAVTELSDRFNSGANGETAFPVVADARALELNQAALAWRGARMGAAIGRQRIVLDNQRFIGNVGWRQNEQTFDAVSFDAALPAAWTLRYHWLDRVHRVAGDEARDPLARERDLDAHLLNAAWTQGPHTLVAYSYLVQDQDVAAASTRTLGARWTCALDAGDARWSWTLEAARQHDHADNPRAFAHDYFLAEPSVTWAGVNWKAGWERLDGDGTHAFQTPLATLHAFNGWADKFLVTPPSGLDDRYVSASGKLGGGAWQDRFAWGMAYHDFDAAQGDAAYGHELNGQLGAGLGHGWSALLKLADYRSDGFARDTRKIWLQLEWTH